MKKIELNKNWKFRLLMSDHSREITHNLEKWKDATVPGTVHTDLMNLGLIFNPFFEDNELKLKWITESNWEYSTTFDFPEQFDKNSHLYLIFEGLDTFADIFLNDIEIGKCDNMFRKYSFDVTSAIKALDNQLFIRFSSATKYSMLLEEQHGKLYVEVNTERVYARKAQYSFGWDWGPSLPTVGIYKPVYLKQKNGVEVKNIKFNTINISNNKAEVEVDIDVERNPHSDDYLEVNFLLENKIIKQNIVRNISDNNKVKEVIANPLLWWPCCLGDQPLYLLEVSLKNKNNQILEKQRRKVGIRIVKLLLKENNQNTFKFLINNKELFIKGVNWIPADSFLSRVSERKYKRLLLLAKKANCNMIRVWGGGTYERDIFYELCDEYGLLVWQDFMFACGSYPEYDEFQENVKQEIQENVERLQYHPSISIWCGNNECEWLWYQKQDHDISRLPGYGIYHKLIPNILDKLDPLRPYWPSTPYGYDEDPNDQNSGNTHQWNIWSNWIDYTEVIKDNSLFVSEFGFQAPANRDTWLSVISKNNLYCDSPFLEFHNKQIDGQKRIFQFISNQLPVSKEWNDCIYLAQLNQGLALKSCIEHWISNRPITNGTIIWQLNDCWPAVSWSIIDSNLKPKMAYYFVKNSFSPRLLFFKSRNEKVTLNFINQSKENIVGRLRLTVLDSLTGNVLKDNFLDVKLRSENRSEIISIRYDELPENKNWILTAVLYDSKGLVIARNYHLEKLWKQVQLNKQEISTKIFKKNNRQKVLMKTANPAFFVDLYHPEYIFSDRGFFILPEEEISLDISGKFQEPLSEESIEINSLNNYLKK